MTKKASALRDRRILITRTGRSAKTMADEVEAFGGEALVAPVLAFHKREVLQSDLEQALENDWLIFTSGTGVLFFIDLLNRYYGDHWPKLPPSAVVGRKTAEVLENHHIKATLIPETYTARDLASLFKAFDAPQRVTLIQGQLARPTLSAELTRQGHHSQTLTVYDTRPNLDAQKDLKKWVSESKMDVATFASPSSIDFFLEMTGLRVSDSFFERIQIACIGPETRAHALQIGLGVSIMPKTYTAKALIEAIADYYLEGSTCTH